MNLLIVGGSGFIGKSFIDGFYRGIFKKNNLNKIYILSRKPWFLKKCKGLNLKNIKIIQGDISKIKRLPDCNIIIYAAETTNPLDYKVKKNSFNLFTKSINNFYTLVKNKKKVKILYLSSGSVYGPQYANVNKVSEKSICNINYKISEYKYTYSKVKLYSETKIANLCKFGLSTSIARCFTFVGPWLPKNSHYAIKNFFLDGFNKRNINLKSKYKIVRSYMYSDDLICWLLKIAVSANRTCPIYNVGSDQAISLEKLAKIVGRVFNQSVRHKKINNNKIDRYIPSIDKAKKVLNLKIKFDLKRSILLTKKYSNET